MSPDTDTFEQELAARMGAATDTIDAAGVTREAVDERLAARRAARRRRQGGMVLAAAALVIAAGIAALAIGAASDQDTSVITDEGTGQTTEAPTTEAPTTTECRTVSDPGAIDEVTSCEVPETTTPPTTASSTTTPPTTTEAPTTTETPTTTTEAPTTTTAPQRAPFSPTGLSFVRGVIAGEDVSALVQPGFDPVADMRSELPEDLTGFVAQPVDGFDWNSWSGSSTSPLPDEPSCAFIGDSSVICVVSVAREDYSLFLHVYMTANGPARVSAVDSDAD